MFDILKYPRTPHLEGSKLQDGDSDDGQVAIESLLGQGLTLTWEEKIDGANSGMSFDGDANLRLQSRGHFLTGGHRERQFNLFKQWASYHEDALFDLLGTRYVPYGEWCFAKHTVFYDALPHYWLEFDIFDREQNAWLSTAARRRLLAGSPILSVPVIGEYAQIKSKQDMIKLIRPSLYKTASWYQNLTFAARKVDVPVERAIKETDQCELAEGLYLKVEDGDFVVGRYKFVRPDFLQAILDSGSHWATRILIQNQLAPGVDIFVR